MHCDVPYFLWNGSRPSYKHIKIYAVRVYIINRSITRKYLGDRSHTSYFMVYVSTTGVIVYWMADHPFAFHRSHNVRFDEYNCCISIEDKHNPVSLLLQQYLESLIHNWDLLNLIPCEVDILYTIFCDTKIITYEIELPPSGEKIGYNSLDDEDFTRLYVTGTIPNSPAGHKLPTHYEKICGSFLKMEKSLSQIKARLMNLITIKVHVENPRSRSAYEEGRGTRGQIL